MLHLSSQKIISNHPPKKTHQNQKAKLRFQRENRLSNFSVLIFNLELDYHTRIKVRNEAHFCNISQDLWSHWPVLHDRTEENKMKISISSLHSESWGQACSNPQGYEMMNTELTKRFGMGSFSAFFSCSYLLLPVYQTGKFSLIVV